MLRPVALVACLLALTACGHTVEPPVAANSPLPPAPLAAVPTLTKPEVCPMPDSGFDCDVQKRIKTAQDYAETRPGTVGIVLRDRKNNVVWRNEAAAKMVWTASTIKLAMVVNLLERHRAGRIKLTTDDRRLITAVLHSSDDDAADTLWKRYDRTTFQAAFKRYGMTGLVAQQGYGATFPYWGYEKCTTDDLDRLMTYVLEKVPAEDRAYIVEQMRQVGPEQQWGVWGPDSGVKNGWSEEDTGWVMNSVGFVGERYTLAVMNDLAREGGYDDGRATTTEVARILFR